ncbi:hypothetical protein GOBAR_AA30316 [Gossypium barbadense]|uniref:DUF4283 domain-containing protein n=1 Tax=Gossypium barbadense TaxID=3634 RepID=A0A2P5WH00_GOSBA|nr:hypothetical protein GOBAR_AA30316 [Gossypium barbadense]
MLLDDQDSDKESRENLNGVETLPTIRIGKLVGKPIKVDSNTSLGTRGKFAGICVEVDLSKPLLSQRHKRSRCSRRLWPRPTVTENLVDADGPKRYGPWMLVKRNPSEGKKHQQQEFRDGAYFQGF